MDDPVVCPVCTMPDPFIAVAVEVGFQHTGEGLFGRTWGRAVVVGQVEVGDT